MSECTIAQEQCGGKCTGYDGAKIWKKLHDLPKQIECETCAEEGKNLFDFAVCTSKTTPPIWRDCLVTVTNDHLQRIEPVFYV